MKLLVTLFITAFIFVQPAFAEHGHKGQRMEKHGQHIERLIQKLQLSDDQLEAFKNIMKGQHEKHRAVMKEMHEQARPKMEAIYNDTKQRLSTILNDEQLQHFEEMMQKRHDHMHGRMNKEGFDHHKHKGE